MGSQVQRVYWGEEEMWAMSQLWKSNFPKISVWHCYTSIGSLILAHEAWHPKHICPEFEELWHLEKSSISATRLHRDGGGGNQGRWQLGEHQQPWWASLHGLSGSRILSNYSHWGPGSRQYSPVINNLDLRVRQVYMETPNVIPPCLHEVPCCD